MNRLVVTLILIHVLYCVYLTHMRCYDFIPILRGGNIEEEDAEVSNILKEGKAKYDGLKDIINENVIIALVIIFMFFRSLLLIDYIENIFELFNKELYAIVLTQKDNGTVGYYWYDDGDGGVWISPEMAKRRKDVVYSYNKGEGELLAKKLQVGEDEKYFTVTIKKR